MQRIADQGLNGVTGRASAGIMVAMIEADVSPAGPAKARAAVAAFRAFLATPVARLIDENPFGVAVGLRENLGRALDDISARLGG